MRIEIAQDSCAAALKRSYCPWDGNAIADNTRLALAALAQTTTPQTSEREALRPATVPCPTPRAASCAPSHNPRRFIDWTR